MTYLKEDVDYDNKHGHSEWENVGADEKHISKLIMRLKDITDEYSGNAKWSKVTNSNMRLLKKTTKSI